MGLELYGRIEPFLGFEEEAEYLYELYIEILRSWRPKKVIDIGCGSGRFLSLAKRSLSLKRAFGIDLSEEMVRRARKTGVDAELSDLCKIDEPFDAATAVFDVLNYLDKDELHRFMGCAERVLEPGGVFIADINTLHGFEEVATGTLARETEDRFLVLDSDFSDGCLETSINLFQKGKNGCYRREQDTIAQYYHTIEEVAEASGLELIQLYPVTLYSDRPDKEVLVLKKEV